VRNRRETRHRTAVFWSIKSLVVLALFVTSVFYGLEQLRATSSKNKNLGIIGDKMGKRVILYHTNWANYGRNFQVKDIPVQGVTDIAYAFFNLKDEGGGNWVITSGDTYDSLERVRLTVVGQTTRIRSLERVFLLRTLGLRQRKT